MEGKRERGKKKRGTTEFTVIETDMMLNGEGK